MTIDQDGKIVVNYNRIKTADETPDEPEVVWDNYKKIFACTYNESSYALFGNSNLLNAIGFLRLDPGLYPLTGICYYKFPYNFSTSITMTLGGNYVIGGSKSDMSMPSFTNPLFMGIDANNYYPLYTKRYNIWTNVPNGSFHRTDANGNNYMIPAVYDPNYGFQYRPRMIMSNVFGDACGAVLDSFDHHNFDPIEQHFYYTWRDFYTIYDYYPPIWQDSLMQDSCDGNNNPDYYRFTSSNPVSQNTLTVNPSLITGNFENVKCSYSLTHTGVLNLVVSDVLGREIYKQTISVASNEGVIEIPAYMLENGLNIVRIYLDNDLIKVTKLMKL
jgi:hypothetical protein